MIDNLFIPVLVFLTILSVSIGFIVLNEILTALPFQINIGWLNSAFIIVLYIIYFGVPIAAIILSLLSGGTGLLLVLSFFLLVFNVFISYILKGVIIDFVNSYPALQNLFSDQILATLIEFYPFFMFLFGVAI
ncbi:MAG: hypothetical protein N2482_03765, partial [Patescibacteria group bacterium]|nr:hypothetical protein [Patescibacteria group bacterium]